MEFYILETRIDKRTIVKIHIIERESRRDLKVIPKLYNVCREFKPDIIVGWGILNSYTAMKVAGRNNTPFIYYWIDVLHDLIPFKPFRPIGRVVERKVLKRADRVLAINEKLREYVTGQGAHLHQTQVLGAGVNIDQFDPAVDGHRLREQCGFQKQNIVLFFMGWLYNFSGLRELAETRVDLPDSK